ncbi:MAG: sulfotransferase [Chloroflexota bacterium]|nr:sulfotransferase [Chloroflexota bacterium]
MTSPNTETEKPPIFIIGCARSGTTLLRLVLDSHSHISAGPETKFLPDMARMIERWKLPAKFGLPREYWLERMREFYGTLQADYMRARGKRRWAEKSPVYTLHLDLLEELYPDAQYVHLIRDARDVVASTRDRWGYRAGYSTALRKWRRYVTTARAFGAQVGPQRYYELRYEDLVAAPEARMRELIAFLGERWEPRVLDYDKVEHDHHADHLAHQANRRRQTGDARLIYASRIRRGANLDPLLRLATWLGTRDLQRELGYLGAAAASESNQRLPAPSPDS